MGDRYNRGKNKLQSSMLNDFYINNTMEQQDQYVDSKSTVGGGIEYGNRNVDRMNQMLEDQGLIDNSLDFIPGSKLGTTASRLGRFDREAAAMARAPIKEYLNVNGRELRDTVQYNANKMSGGFIPKFLGDKLPTKTRWVDEEVLGDAGATYNKYYNQITMPKNTVGKQQPAIANARDNVRQIMNLGHETGHANDPMLLVNKYLKAPMELNTFKKLGYNKKDLNHMVDFNQNAQSEFIGYNEGVGKLLDIVKKNKDPDMVQAAEEYLKWHADMFAPIAEHIPKDTQLYKLAKGRAKRIETEIGVQKDLDERFGTSTTDILRAIQARNFSK